MALSDITPDRAIKILFLKDPRAVAKWLFGVRPTKVRTIDPGFSTSQERLGDKLIFTEFPDERRTLLHVEAQLAGDATMGRRMLAYVGLIGQLLGLTAYRRCGFRQVVIYLDRARYRRDPGEFLLPGEGDCGAYVRYQVIRLWEVKPKILLGIRSYWLRPFVPLSRVGAYPRTHPGFGRLRGHDPASALLVVLLR